MPRGKQQTYETESKVLPTRLRELMDAKNISQATLGDAVGVRRQTISLYTTGQSNPSWEQVAAIASYFGVTADYLVGLEDCTTHEDSSVSTKIGLSEQAIKQIHSFMIERKDMSFNNAHLYTNFQSDYPDIEIPASISLSDLVDYLIASGMIEKMIPYFVFSLNSKALTNIAKKIISESDNTKETQERLTARDNLAISRAESMERISAQEFSLLIDEYCDLILNSSNLIQYHDDKTMNIEIEKERLLSIELDSLLDQNTEESSQQRRVSLDGQH